MAKKVAAKKEKTVVAAPAPVTTEARKAVRRELIGTVVSDKMQKTIVVRVDRRVKHRFYEKFVNQSRKFKAHDETNQAKMGDLVTIVESRPISKDKRWALKSVVRTATFVEELKS